MFSVKLGKKETIVANRYYSYYRNDGGREACTGRNEEKYGKNVYLCGLESVMTWQR